MMYARCNVTDDNDHVCNKPMTKKEWEQDGMCTRCADLIWNNYVVPMRNNKPTKPIIHDDRS